MPNYVKNILTFTGDSQTIEKLFKTVKTKESDFDFNTIIPMPESLNIESGSSSELSYDYICYLKSKKMSDNLTRLYQRYANQDEANKENLTDTGFEKYLQAQCFLNISLGKQVYENVKKYGYKDWYDWSRKVWGTKWNAMVAEKINENEIDFDTAWTAPFPVMMKLSAMFPTITIHHQWADEDIGANTGEQTYLAGEIIEPDTVEEFSSEAYQIYEKCWGETECIGVDDDGQYFRRTCDECKLCK